MPQILLDEALKKYPKLKDIDDLPVGANGKVRLPFVFNEGSQVFVFDRVSGGAEIKKGVVTEQFFKSTQSKTLSDRIRSCHKLDVTDDGIFMFTTYCSSYGDRKYRETGWFPDVGGCWVESPAGVAPSIHFQEAELRNYIASRIGWAMESFRKATNFHRYGGKAPEHYQKEIMVYAGALADLDELTRDY